MAWAGASYQQLLMNKVLLLSSGQYQRVPWRSGFGFTQEIFRNGGKGLSDDRFVCLIVESKRMPLRAINFNNLGRCALLDRLS